MKEYRQNNKDGSVNITWPRDVIFNAMVKNMEVRIEKSKSRFSHDISAVRKGMIYKIETLSFSLQGAEGVNYCIDYACVVSIEILHVESKASEPVDLEKEMWYLSPDAKHDDYHRIRARVDVDGVYPEGSIQPILNLLELSRGAALLVEAHNAAIEKLNERTIRQVCEDSGIPMTMTKDGIEVGDNAPVNILEAIKNNELTINKTEDDSETAVLKTGKPDRVILEYDIDKVTQRRIIIDGNSCVIEDLDWTVNHEE